MTRLTGIDGFGASSRFRKVGQGGTSEEICRDSPDALDGTVDAAARGEKSL